MNSKNETLTHIRKRICTPNQGNRMWVWVSYGPKGKFYMLCHWRSGAEKLSDTIYHARSLLGSTLGSTLQGRKTRRMKTGNAELPCSHKVALANYSEELWRLDDPSEVDWGVWAFIPPHQPVTEHRQTSGRERKLGLNAKSNSRNEPQISLFTKHLHLNRDYWTTCHLSPWNPLSFRSLVSFVSAAYSLSNCSECYSCRFYFTQPQAWESETLTERNLVWTIFLKRQLLL